MIEKIIEKIGSVCSWLSFALVILITIDVFLRYIFNFSSASLYELEWHFFAIIFLLGSSITLQKDEHVRVDVFYNRFSNNKKEIVAQKLIWQVNNNKEFRKEEIHSFSWLRHLKARSGPLARKQARKLIKDWLKKK